MFQNYLKTTLRNLIRNPVYTSINIIGLTVGLTASILILIYLRFEVSFDRFIPAYEDLYRIYVSSTSGGKTTDYSLAMTPLGPEMQKEFPEVMSYTRIHKEKNNILLSFEDTKFYESRMVYADSGFFETFGYQLLQGDPKDILKVPWTVVLTKSLAEKYFGNEDPVGKKLIYNLNETFTVTGIMEDPPVNTHFKFDLIASFTTLYRRSKQEWMDKWTGEINYYLYVRLQPGSHSGELLTKLNDLVKEKTASFTEEDGISLSPGILPVKDIYLKSHLLHEIGDTGNINYIYIFFATGLLILIIASINFMNLSTARSASRAREVGIRKVSGGSRSSLISQFLIESVVLCFVALLISWIMIELLLPSFSRLMTVELDKNLWHDPAFLILSVGLAILLGIISGSYPAFILSAFRPIKVLKGELSSGSKRSMFRNILVIVQFVISCFLISSVLLVNKQLSYIRTKDLGFNKEQIIIIPLNEKGLREKHDVIKEKFSDIPGIVNVSASQNYPGTPHSANYYQWEDLDETEKLVMSSIDVDEDYLDTYQMELLYGRNFSAFRPADEKSLLLNEAAVSFLGFEDPLNRRVTFNNVEDYQTIGVVKDFHFNSLHVVLEPMVISYRKFRFRYLNVRMDMENFQETMDLLKEEWKTVDPDRPMDFFFLDERLDRLYRNEKELGNILIYFSLLAIFTALLGLFGLVSYLIEQRTKEVGVRKVMGSSQILITGLFYKEFLRLVIISCLISWPAVYFFGKNWLQNFAYQTNLSWWIFVVALLLSVVVASLTVGYQVIRASRLNPAAALRYE